MTDKNYPLHHTDAEPLYVTIEKDVFEAMSSELEELRKHETELDLLMAGNKAYKQRIKELKELNQWRKVSEELPEEYKEILFIDADGGYYLGSMFTIPHYDGTPNEQYWSGRGEPRSTNVTHWMPLPEPPKEGA